MSFIRLGKGCFRKSKIMCIDVSIDFHGSRTLKLMYEEPYAVRRVESEGCGDYIEYSPTMTFQIRYDGTHLNTLLAHIKAIKEGNPDCLLDPGVASLINNE